MFKLSILEKRGEQRLVLEGKLTSPWTLDVENTWRELAGDSHERKPVIDLRNVTFISMDGESTLLKLMKEGAQFDCGDVLTKYVLKRLARRCRCIY